MSEATGRDRAIMQIVLGRLLVLCNKSKRVTSKSLTGRNVQILRGIGNHVCTQIKPFDDKLSRKFSKNNYTFGFLDGGS